MHQKIMITKHKIQTSLIHLLQSNSIHQISICELCHQAQIHRSTFYKHYGSQYDVLNEISTQYLKDAENCIQGADAHDKESVAKAVASLLEYMEEHLELSRLLLNNIVDAAFAEKVFSLQKVSELLQQSLSHVEAYEKQAMISFVIYGCWKLLISWINDSNRINPDKQATLMLSLAGKICHSS